MQIGFFPGVIFKTWIFQNVIFFSKLRIFPKKVIYRIVISKNDMNFSKICRQNEIFVTFQKEFIFSIVDFLQEKFRISAALTTPQIALTESLTNPNPKPRTSSTPPDACPFSRPPFKTTLELQPELESDSSFYFSLAFWCLAALPKRSAKNKCMSKIWKFLLYYNFYCCVITLWSVNSDAIHPPKKESFYLKTFPYKNTKRE